MVNATAPAPPLRDRSLDLDHLARLARTFDAIGDEIGGARYPAVSFVQWLADEYAATGRRARHDLDAERRSGVMVNKPPP